MAKPKFTDTHKYPHGYDASHDTDISRVWARARKKLEALKEERAEKVREIKTIGAKHGK